MPVNGSVTDLLLCPTRSLMSSWRTWHAEHGTAWAGGSRQPGSRCPGSRAADIRDPEAALASRGLRGLLYLGQPFCVLLASVLHFLPADEADAAVAAFRRLMIPGNYLVISAGTSTGTDPGLISRLQAACDDTMPVGRTAEEVSAWFEVSPWPNPASPTSGPGAPTTRSARAKSRLREPDSWPPSAANQLARIVKAAGTVHACPASHLNSQSCSAASGTDARLVPGCGGVAGERRSRPWCGQAGCRR